MATIVEDSRQKVGKHQQKHIGFDSLGVDVIYSESFDTPQIGAAIMNRLIKAAGHHILSV